MLEEYPLSRARFKYPPRLTIFVVDLAAHTSPTRERSAKAGAEARLH